MSYLLSSDGIRFDCEIEKLTINNSLSENLYNPLSHSRLTREINLTIIADTNTNAGLINLLNSNQITLYPYNDRNNLYVFYLRLYTITNNYTGSHDTIELIGELISSEEPIDVRDIISQNEKIQELLNRESESEKQIEENKFINKNRLQMIGD